MYVHQAQSYCTSPTIVFRYRADPSNNKEDSQPDVEEESLEDENRSSETPGVLGMPPFPNIQLCLVQYGEFGRWSLVGVKVCLTTNSPNTVHTFCSGQVGRIKVWIFWALKRVNHAFDMWSLYLTGYFQFSIVVLFQSILRLHYPQLLNQRVLCHSQLEMPWTEW